MVVWFPQNSDKNASLLVAHTLNNPISRFRNQVYVHFMNNDLRILRNSKSRKIFMKDPKYLKAAPFSFLKQIKRYNVSLLSVI